MAIVVAADVLKALAVDQTGHMLATASATASVIRVFSLPDMEMCLP